MNPIWFFVIVFAAIIIIFLIAFFIYFLIHNDRIDYKVGGGIQIGGDEKINIFAPANDKAGIHGEKIVNEELRLLLRNDEYLLVNLLLPFKNGRKTEIDCVLVSRKGIFCIETKRWVGHIIGNDEDERWIQQYDDPYKGDITHNNPVLQNEFHCKVLDRVLNYKYEIENAVIFCSLEDGSGINSKFVYTISEFKTWYRTLDELGITDFEIKQISQILQKYVATNEQIKQFRNEQKNRNKH